MSGCRIGAKIIHSERRRAAVIETECGNSHVVHFTQLGECNMSVKARDFGEFPSTGPPHQIEHVDADPKNSGPVARALQEPVGAVTRFVRFLSIYLCNLTNTAVFHYLSKREIRR